jgi:outer membrane protein assembly factor BamD (BamD/ComL family)
VIPSAGIASPRVSRLDAEASLLAKVRSQLHSGDPHGALATLNQLQTAFPNGQLTQERDVLTVEVLAANGNTAAAKRKANAFIAAHRSSPHSAKLERFVESR